MGEELKRCPFCDGSGGVVPLPPYVIVRCHECAAEGPTADNVAKAVRAWNQRT